MDRETVRWEQRGQGPSQLRDELAAASETLSRFPYAGQQDGQRFRLQLGRTNFSILYRVDERRELVNIVSIVHGHHRRARRRR